MGIIVRNMNMNNFSHVRLGAAGNKHDFIDLNNFTLLAGSYDVNTGIHIATGSAGTYTLRYTTPISRYFYFETLIIRNLHAIVGIGYGVANGLYANLLPDTRYGFQTSTTKLVWVNNKMQALSVNDIFGIMRNNNELHHFRNGDYIGTVLIEDRDDYYIKVMEGSSNHNSPIQFKSNNLFYDESLANIPSTITYISQ